MYVIAIVGAGGKTSRIKNLTREYVQQGKKRSGHNDDSYGAGTGHGFIRKSERYPTAVGKTALFVSVEVR